MKIKKVKEGYECGHLQHKNNICFNIISDVDIHNTIFHKNHF